MGGLILSGLLTNAFGWEVIFYVHGGLIVIWFFCWIILGFKDPESHPRISEVNFCPECAPLVDKYEY